MDVSVIVPVRNDAAALQRLLPQIPADPQVEVIVVEGAGRGRQMNEGAAAATGDWLFFLHADSRLPAGWLDAIRTTTAGGGWFTFALDDRAWQARVIERLVAMRVRLLRLPYGDQGFFVRRELFQRLGGYTDIPLMEDVDFIRRLSTAAPVRQLRLPLVTSARRWRADGWWARSIRNLILVTLFFAGVSPHRLAKWY